MPLLAQAAQTMRTLDRRLETVAHNMANVDTPGFRRLMLTEHAEGPSMAIGRRAAATTPSESPLDVAVQGEAFLVVQGANGTEGLTRNGHLVRGQDGVVRSAGLPVLGEEGPLRLDATPAEIHADGGVWQGGRRVGRLRLALAGADLTAVGGGVYVSRAAKPAANARVESAALEGSNVNVLAQLTDMMDAVRSFEMSQKIALTDSDIRKKLTDEVGRTR